MGRHAVNARRIDDHWEDMLRLVGSLKLGKAKDTTRTYPLDVFKQMLHLKDPKGEEPELFQNISQLKARVLDIALRQVSEHTNLKID